MIKNLTYGLFLSVLLFGCKQVTEDSDPRQKVVKVYSHVLYEEDVLKQIPFGTSYEDSISIRNSYVNSWIDSKLLLHQAELNLPLDEQNVTEKLEHYRTDLLIFAYQNQLLMEKLDTNVSDFEIEKYYQDHSRNFALLDYILKAKYVKLDSLDKNIKKVKKWIVSSKEDDFVKLEDYCYMHSSNYSFEENWMYLNDLLKEVPIVSYNKEKLLKNNKLIEFYDKGSFYLVRIVDYKLKDGVSPLALERESIKRIILNDRKLEFLQSLSSDIYENAKNQKEIELFIP